MCARAILLLILIMCFTVSASGFSILYHIGPNTPDSNKTPVDGDGYWNDWPSGGIQDIDANTVIWIAKDNNESDEFEKTVTVELKGSNLDFDEAQREMGGVKVNGEQPQVKETYGGPIQQKEGYRAGGTFNPKPSGEWIKLVAESDNVDINEVKITCKTYYIPPFDKDNWDYAVKLNTNEVYDPPSRVLITEFWYFPEEVSIDTSVEPNFVGPDGSGDWTYQWVYEDPDEEPKPQGGVRWTTNGSGVADGQGYYTSFNCVGKGPEIVLEYLYDANATSFEPYIPMRLWIPPCVTIIPGDIDENCKVDFVDFALLAGNWVQCNDRRDPNCSLAP